MVIDFHTHCFPERIAAAAIAKLSAGAGALKPWTDGTPGGTLRELKRCGVDRAVALSIATSPAQMRSVNDFAAGLQSEGFISFGSVHPAAPDALDELDRIASLGLKGVKFHPQYQRFAADNEAVFPLYRKAARLGLITVFHAGLDLGFADSEIASPRAIAGALPAFGGAPVVAAHMGGYARWGEAGECLAGLPVYFDTAFSHSHIPLPEAIKLIEKHGVDRILFGSDLPWSDITLEREFVLRLDLSPDDTQKILCGNAQRLLGPA